MLRAVSVLSAAAAGGLLAWAGYTAVRTPANELRPAATGAEDDSAPVSRGVGLVVEDAEQNLGERPVGGNRVVFRVTNRSGRPAEVVGLTEGCAGGCCFFLTGPGRVSVPEGGTVEVAGELGVGEPGPFQFVGKMFLSEGEHFRAVRLKVTGVGVSGGKLDATPP